MSADISGAANLDNIFAEIGDLGIYQITSYILIFIPNVLSSSFVVSYMFAAKSLDYRCRIDECDSDGSVEYQQPWLQNVIPMSSNNTIDKCHRYASFNSTRTDVCEASHYDTRNKVKCTEYVHRTNENNLQTEFKIHCDDSYKLALIGTANNVGRALFLPLTGILSDKFGRLTVVVTGMTLCNIFGTIKSFATSYFMYISMEFFEASAGTCTFAGIYILGIEWVSSKYRVIGSTFVALSFPFGEMVIGTAATYINDYRILLRSLYLPGFLIIFYFWLVPESVRWLLVTGRIDRAIKILKRTATVNGRTLSEKSIEALRLRYGAPATEIKIDAKDAKEQVRDAQPTTFWQSICAIVKSRTLLIRLTICCFQWTTCCYCFYGLSLISTYIGSNGYTSFILVAAIEIPGILLSVPTLQYFARRYIMCITLSIAGIAMLLAPFVPKESTTLILILFLIAKCSVTLTFNNLYIYTAEQWPTSLRTTIMNLCSMIGRTGAMVAPLTPLLAQHFEYLPYILFGGSSILAGFSALFCPETFGRKLPDTIEEATNL